MILKGKTAYDMTCMRSSKHGTICDKGTAIESLRNYDIIPHSRN
jgi:hypothetical protein